MVLHICSPETSSCNVMLWSLPLIQVSIRAHLQPHIFRRLYSSIRGAFDDSARPRLASARAQRAACGIRLTRRLHASMPPPHAPSLLRGPPPSSAILCSARLPKLTEATAASRRQHYPPSVPWHPTEGQAPNSITFTASSSSMDIGTGRSGELVVVLLLLGLGLLPQVRTVSPRVWYPSESAPVWHTNRNASLQQSRIEIF